MVDQRRLTGRRALITGSGRGIGRAIAEHFATQGAAVVVSARSADQVGDVVDSIRRQGGAAAGIVADITSDDSVDELKRRAEEYLSGPVDTLVNNAGVYTSKRFEDQAMADWEWTLDVNVLGTVRVTRAFLPSMIDLPRARIIMIASIAGKKGSVGQSAYNASKHAQIGLTRCLALEYGHSAVRVNAICPGFIATDLIDLDDLATAHESSTDDMWADIEAASSIGRTVTVGEVAEMAGYLASPAADGINGQSLVIDGGIAFP